MGNDLNAHALQRQSREALQNAQSAQFDPADYRTSTEQKTGKSQKVGGPVPPLNNKKEALQSTYHLSSNPATLSSKSATEQTKNKNQQIGLHVTSHLNKKKKHSFHSRLLNVEDIQFPLSTDKTKIVDAKGNRVKLAGVNWSGAHMCRHCVDGLESRKLRDLCRQIREFGFNTVRLTFSLQMFYDDNVIPNKYLSANPQLFNITAMKLFDLTVKQLTDAGVMVILNNHISSSMWCCSETDGEGLWWTPQYPEYKWLQCLKNFAARYKDNPRVVAFDLRNQIRKCPNYEPTWGDDVPQTDWRRASILGANTVLQENPNMLIIIGGLNFGLDLKGIMKRPVTGLIVPNKLVYTGHFYGFSWGVITWKLWSYDAFRKRMWEDQMAIQQLGVPFFLGQFGTNVADVPYKYLITLMKQADMDFTYWPLDGFKCEPEKDQTYGIYDNNFREVRHPWLLKDLQSLQQQE